MQIRFLENHELDQVVPFLVLLNDGLSEAELHDRLEGMKAHNYHCIGVFNDEGILVAISGIWKLYKHYIGAHIEADNVIVHPDHRGHGYGQKLVDWMHEWAKSEGHTCVELNAYKEDEQARSFWEHQGYYWVGVHYRRWLD